MRLVRRLRILAFQLVMEVGGDLTRWQCVCDIEMRLQLALLLVLLDLERLRVRGIPLFIRILSNVEVWFPFQMMLRAPVFLSCFLRSLQLSGRSFVAGMRRYRLASLDIGLIRWLGICDRWADLLPGPSVTVCSII